MKNDITSSRSMYDVLRASDRLKHEVKGVSGVLAFLWRSILQERNIGLVQFDSLCMLYVTKARRQTTTAKIANYFNRSNIYREMSRPTMTFKALIRGIQLIGIRRIKITFELEGRGFTSTHSTSMTLGGDEGIQYADTLEDDNDKKMEAPADHATNGRNPTASKDAGSS